MKSSKRCDQVSKIILVMLSQIDTIAAGLLSRNLEEIFCRPVEVRYKIASLQYAYDAARKQYVSPLLLSRLRRMKKGSGDKIMAVTDVDLYSPGYDFVYGEADLHAGVATLSINRLLAEEGDAPQNSRKVTKRIIREATHEIGHLFGLGHCRNQKCVMRTCTCLAEVDEAKGGLCTECNNKLKPNL